MQLLNLLRKIERSVLVALFLIMVLLYTGSVVTREIGGTFASRFAWIEEAVRMMNLFLVFLALGLALGLARSFASSTRFIVDKNHARRMMLRARYILEAALAVPEGKEARLKLPIRMLFSD